MSTPTIRVLPQSLEAERGVLSVMLQFGVEAIEAAAAELTEDHFTVPQHQIIFRQICATQAAQRLCEIGQMTTELRDQGLLDAVGGAFGLTDVWGAISTGQYFRQHLVILRQKFVLRRIIAHSVEYGRRAFEEQDEAGRLLEEFQATAVEIGSMSSDAEALRPVSKEEVIARLDVIEERYKNRGKIGGLSTGLVDLDRTLDGLKGKHLYVMAGRPGMGKTAIGMNIAAYCAVTAIESAGVPVAFFSLEMPREQLLDRILFSRAEISLQRVRDGFMSEKGFADLQAAAGQLFRSKLVIDDTPGLTIAQFRARARKAVLRHKARLIVIDYVQIMKGSSKRAGDNRALEIAEIMQGIRETAKQLDVPIIVLAQINRAAEDRSNSRPTLADLKESGAIEEEANVVGLLYRPAYYAKTDAKRAELAEQYGVELDEVDTIAFVDIAKHRNGGVGPIRLKFLGELTKFEGVTEKLWSNDPTQRQHGAGRSEVE